jgi:hypothetical protein
MHLDGHVFVGEATSGMSLVFNRTQTSKKVTVDGHMLGGKEKAWVTADDPVLLTEIDNGTLKLLTNGNIVVSSESENMIQPATTIRRRSKRQ